MTECEALPRLFDGPEPELQGLTESEVLAGWRAVRAGLPPPDDCALDPRPWWARCGFYSAGEPYLEPAHGHADDHLWLNFMWAEALLLPLELAGLQVEYDDRYGRDGRRAANEWLRIQVRGE